MLWTPGKYSGHPFFMFLLLLLKWKWLLCFSVSSFQLNKSNVCKRFSRTKGSACSWKTGAAPVRAHSPECLLQQARPPPRALPLLSLLSWPLSGICFSSASNTDRKGGSSQTPRHSLLLGSRIIPQGWNNPCMCISHKDLFICFCLALTNTTVGTRETQIKKYRLYEK